ncbi:uncharacterized protein [Ambystoma mexicanum]|uniref:uncharacterized protein n=1 Tax=Ambystoma mexicanum TaxID=8296 RepID=UPI0037E725BE
MTSSFTPRTWKSIENTSERYYKGYANTICMLNSKCEFHQTTVKLLAFILSPQGVTMDKNKVQSIIDWPSPKSVKDIQSILGFANFYRRFIDGFAKKVQPITRLLRKGVPFLWDEKAEAGFEALKRTFITTPVLQHPDAAKP